MSTRSKSHQIDLGLAISAAGMKPGERRSRKEIAAYCGCSYQAIELIEHRALRKLRHRLQFGSMMQMGRELAACCDLTADHSPVHDSPTTPTC